MTIPTRILHLIDTAGPGGAETILTSIVGGLAPTSWRSRVLIPEGDWLFGRLQELGADTRVLKSRGTGDFRLLAAFISSIREYRPALVHAHLLTSGVYGSLAATLAGGVPLVCTFHGKPDVDAADKLLPVKARLLCRPANRIVYVAHDLRRYLEPLLGIPRHLGVTIHNGIAFAHPHPADERDVEARAASGVLLVGAVGNIREPKDYPNLLRAAAIVCQQRSDVRFVVAGGGGGHLRGRLDRMLTELGLGDRVQFLGFRKDVNELISSLDVFVSSSSNEGLPLSTLEAMGMGKPVVLTRCGGPAEIVEDGRTGVLVPPRDPRALARGILAMLADPEKRRTYGMAGATEVRERFSRERMLSEYETLYRGLLRRYPVTR